MLVFLLLLAAFCVAFVWVLSRDLYREPARRKLLPGVAAVAFAVAVVLASKGPAAVLLCVLLAPLYVGLVWIASRLLCRDRARAESHAWAAAVALALAGFIVSFGVPHADNSRDKVGLPVALGLLVVGPLLLPRFGMRARLGLGLVVLGLFTEPLVRAEYLTWRHGQALRQAVAAEDPRKREDRLFSVLAHSRSRATVLRVEGNKTGYLLDFETDGGGTWRLNPGSYPPQALLWYDGNSGWYDCPYPTSVLLILHGAGAWRG
jgi:hypothetical protein